MFDQILNRPVRITELPVDEPFFMEMLQELIDDGDVVQVEIDGVTHFQLTEQGMLSEDPTAPPAEEEEPDFEL